MGSSELLTFQQVERLAVSDPVVVDYVVLSKAEIMLVAKKVGESDLYVWDKGKEYAYHVMVTPPNPLTPDLVTRIKTAISRPLISVSAHKEVIVLEGEVETAEEAKRAEIIAKAYAPKVENLIRIVKVYVSDTTEPAPAGLPVEKTLPPGGSTVLDFYGVERTLVSDPSVVECVELSKKQVMLVAKKAGSTNLYIWDKIGPHPYRIVVTPPPSRLPEFVKRIAEEIAQPEVKVSAHNEMVLLEGEVASAEEVKRAEEIARAYTTGVVNLLRVRTAAVVPVIDLDGIRRVMGTSIRLSTLADGLLLIEGVATPEQRARLDQIIRAMGNRVGIIDMVTVSTAPPRQIQVSVAAVEINRSSLRELGVDWGGLNFNDDGVGTPTDQPIIFGEAREDAVPLDEFGPFRRQAISARLKALITNNQARILAEPNLLVTEGQLAEVLVGGEIPIPVAQTVGSGTGTVSVEWKEFGVKLAMKALVNPDGQFINLDVAPEVSNLDFGNGIVIGGLRLPALQTRRAHSVLNIRDGQTLVIAGLYQTEESRVERRIPLLSNIPVIGELFRRTDRERRETELVVFVTPRLVSEAAAATRTQEQQQRMQFDPNTPREPIRP